MKTTEDFIEYASATLELFSPITEEVLNGFLDRIERPADLLCGEENTTSGEAGEDVASGDVVGDPRQDIADDVLDPLECSTESISNRRSDRSDGGSHRRDSTGKGAE